MNPREMIDEPTRDEPPRGQHVDSPGLTVDRGAAVLFPVFRKESSVFQKTFYLPEDWGRCVAVLFQKSHARRKTSSARFFRFPAEIFPKWRRGMHTGTARAFATSDPGMSSSRPEGPCGGMLGGAQDEKLGGVMGDETDGHDGDTDDDERQGGGDEDSDHDSISHVVLGTKRKRAPSLHSSSSSDTDHDLFITQLPVSRKRASPHELGEGSSSASHEEGVCDTGDADGASTGEEAPREKLKRQEEELHHRYQNKSHTLKGPKQCGPRPSSSKARRLPPPLIEQYQGAAVWGLLACSKQLKQQHWSKYIQQICNITRAKTLPESEDNVFLTNSFEALVEDTDENVGEEMCGEGGTDRVEIRVVDPKSFILNVVSDAKPALSTKSQAKTVTASRTGKAKPNKKRKRPREKRKQKPEEIIEANQK